MRKLRPKAEFNTSTKPTQRNSWPVTASELADSRRELRSDKPQVVYYSSPKTPQQRQAINVQPRASPRVERIDPTAPLDTAGQTGNPVIEAPDSSLNLAQQVVGQIQQAAGDEEEQDEEEPHDQGEELEGVENEEEGDEVFQDNLGADNEDNNEMAEERNLSPCAFHGRAEENGDEWLRHFLNYCTYKNYEDAKKLALMKVLLTGNAANWFDSLSDDAVANFNALKAAFEKRYKSVIFSVT